MPARGPNAVVPYTLRLLFGVSEEGMLDAHFLPHPLWRSARIPRYVTPTKWPQSPQHPNQSPEARNDRRMAAPNAQSLFNPYNRSKIQLQAKNRDFMGFLWDGGFCCQV